jgi:competence protein ComEC
MIFSMVFAMPAPAQTGTSPTLDVYVIDVEGGNPTLFVSPSHESLLMDTGNVGAVAAPRDAGRILDAMKAAGVQRIDHLITTHWHGDHFGGMAELSSRVPIAEFIDHGPNLQPSEVADAFLQNTYPKLYANGKHITAKAGDRIPMTGLDAIRLLACCASPLLLASI